MSTGLIVVLCISAAAMLFSFAYRWLVVPAVLKKRWQLPAKLNYEEVRGDELPPEIADYIGGTLRQFVAAGFELRTHTFVHTEFDRRQGKTVVATVRTLFVHRETGDAGTAMGTWGPQPVQPSADGKSPVGMRGFGFAVESRFADGLTVETSSSSGVGFLPVDAEDGDWVSVSWVHDVATLYEFHQRRVRAAGRELAPRVPLPRGEEMAFMREEDARVSARGVRHGYQFLAEAAGVYRQTWKGAYLTTWKLMEPIKTWRIRARDRRSRRAWRELGMDEWRAPTAPAVDPTSVTATAAALPLHDAAVRYESVIAPGELRFERAVDALTVRFGTPGKLMSLLHHWPTLLSFGIFGGLIALNIVLAAWLSYTLATRGLVTRSPFGVWFYILLGFFLVDIYKLVRVITFARGTIVLVAGADGLSYRNAPAWTPNGALRRGQIEFLTVLPHAGVFWKTYRLEVKPVDAVRAVPLIVSGRLDLLESARAELCRAMGMEATPAESVAITPATS